MILDLNRCSCISCSTIILFHTCQNTIGCLLKIKKQTFCMTELSYLYVKTHKGIHNVQENERNNIDDNKKAKKKVWDSNPQPSPCKNNLALLCANTLPMPPPFYLCIYLLLMHIN